MTDLQNISSRFGQWLNDALPRLNDTNSVDVHIDELTDERLDPRAQIDRALELFDWVQASLHQALAGRILMLMIPLQSSDALDSRIPDWDSLSTQLSSTPPSIYVLNISSFLQHDPACRYIASLNTPGETSEAYYQCWRLPEDEPEDGWSRDVRVAVVVMPRES